MNTENLLKELKNNPFLLAPMAGITDSPFRSFMKEMGCGIVTTELVSAKSLQLKNERSYKLMSFTENQRPVGVQVFGEELPALAEAAQIVEQSGADFVDLNFGCPVPKIVKKGAGSAVLKDLSFLQKILKTVKQSVSIPVSIKVRTGWDQHSRNTHEIAKIAYNEGIIWLTIHGRTRAQAYSGQADWAYIKKVKSKSLMPIIGNGDLINTKQILKLKIESGCDGMMIGRGCLKNPWIFQEIKNQYKDKNIECLNEGSSNKKGEINISIPIGMENCGRKSGATQEKRQRSYEKIIPEGYNKTLSTSSIVQNINYINILDRLKVHLEKFYDEKLFLLQYKKFSTWYSSGYPDSARFRKRVFQTRNKEEVLNLVQDYFHRINCEQKQEAPYELALMQGHG